MVRLTPKQTLSSSSTAALAYPLSVSTVPENALGNDYSGKFEQTIRWQLLVTWKGRHKPGDVVTTISSYNTAWSGCGPGAIRVMETKLLYLEKNDPLKNPGIYEPQERIEDLKYLQRVGG